MGARRGCCSDLDRRAITATKATTSVRPMLEKIDRRASRHTSIRTRYRVGYKLEPVPK
jgi:hypothetical protein